MTLESKLCLICDDVAVIEVVSVGMQTAPLCGIHWAEFCVSDGGTVGDEIRKYFDDGLHGDVPKPAKWIADQAARRLRTDETPGEYRTDEQEER